MCGNKANTHPGGAVVKNPLPKAGVMGLIPGFRRLGGDSPLEKEIATYSSIMVGKSHVQRKLMGYSVCVWGGSQRVRHN